MTHFRSLDQKSKNNFVSFLVQMRTRKFDFEINWPLPAASFASMHFNWWLEQHHSAWIWLRFEMEMALSLSKNQIHSILSYCAHAIPLLNMENKGLKKRGAKLPLPPYYTLFSIFCQQIEMTSKEFEWMIWEKKHFPRNITYKKIMPQNCQQKTICLWVCHLGHAPVPKK